MKPETRQQVKAVMEEWVERQTRKVRRLTISAISQGYPFHQLIFPPEDLLAAQKERKIVTSMGKELYPSIARVVAGDRFNDVSLEHSVSGTINSEARNMIEEIITELRSPVTEVGPNGRRVRRADHRVPNHVDELNTILNLREGAPVGHTVIADLYVGDFQDGPLFVELKTPLPNLDIAAESKKKMLYFLAIMDRQNVSGAKAFLGLTYNPFVTRARYRHSFTNRIMDMEHQVLIGSELWDYIGGPGAYDELLEIVSEINPSAA